MGRAEEPGPQGEAVSRSPEPSTAPLLRPPPFRWFFRLPAVSVPSPPDHSLQAQAFAPRPLCRRYSIDCVPHEAVARAGRREPWRGGACLRRVGGAQSGAQVLLGVISAVTASRGTWPGRYPHVRCLDGLAGVVGGRPQVLARLRSAVGRSDGCTGRRVEEGTSCLGRADGAHSSSQALLGVIPSSAASRET